MSDPVREKEERIKKLQEENAALKAKVESGLNDVEEMKLMMEQVKRLEEMNALLRRDRDILTALSNNLPEGRLAGQTVLIQEKPAPDQPQK